MKNHDDWVGFPAKQCFFKDLGHLQKKIAASRPSKKNSKKNRKTASRFSSSKKNYQPSKKNYQSQMILPEIVINQWFLAPLGAPGKFWGLFQLFLVVSLWFCASKQGKTSFWGRPSKNNTDFSSRLQKKIQKKIPKPLRGFRLQKRIQNLQKKIALRAICIFFWIFFWKDIFKKKHWSLWSRRSG